MTSYRTGVAVALPTAFLTVWTTVVRDDGNGAGFFMVVLAAGVGAFAAHFAATGMSRAMLGVAVMQAALGTLVATAPSTAALPRGAARVLGLTVALAMLWLGAALLFYRAARAQRRSA